MGGSYPALPSRSSDFGYFALTFRRPDKIYLLLANQDVVRTVLGTVTAHWTSGVQEHTHKYGSCLIRVPGLWIGSSSSRESAIMTKSVCCALLQDLYVAGWRLILSSDLSRVDDLCTMFFRKTSHTSTHSASPPSIICLSLSSRDRLQLINSPRHLWRPLLDAVNSTSSGPDVTINDQDQQNLEIKLNGCPWENASFSEGVEARKILLAVFRTFDKMGYHFYGTANLKGKADSLFFIYDLSSQRQPSGLYQYCMISLNRDDRLRLVDCPITVINAVRDSINAHSKLNAEINLRIVHEFKLKGYPWMANGSEAIAARLLVTTILEKMVSIGWPVLTTLDISRKANDKGVFILRSSGSLSLSSASSSYFCISLNETNKIRLINAPDHVSGTLRKAVCMHWSAGIRREQDYFGSYEMKLNGSPWNGTETPDSLAAKCLMCIILSILEEDGFSVTCSADVSSKYESREDLPDYPVDVHSWFVTRSREDFRQPRVAQRDPEDNNERAASASEERPNFEMSNEPPPSYNELYGK